MFSCYLLVAVAACLLAQPALAKDPPKCSSKDQGNKHAPLDDEIKLVIPQGQDSAYIDIPGWLHINPDRVSIKACDYEGKPTIKISQDLQHAYIYRVGPKYKGDAVIHLRGGVSD